MLRIITFLCAFTTLLIFPSLVHAQPQPASLDLAPPPPGTPTSPAADQPTSPVASSPTPSASADPNSGDPVEGQTTFSSSSDTSVVTPSTSTTVQTTQQATTTTTQAAATTTSQVQQTTSSQAQAAASSSTALPNTQTSSTSVQVSTASSSSIRASTTVTSAASRTTAVETTVKGAAAATSHFAFTTGSQPDAPSASSSAATTDSHTSAAASKGFFSNKAAVGATFTVVGLIAAAALAFFIRSYTRRRRYLDDDADDYFEKYNAGPTPGYGATGMHNFNNDPESAPGASAHTLADPDVSAIEPTLPAVAGAYPDRDVHYGHGAYLHTDDAQAAEYPGYDQRAYQYDATPVVDYPPGMAPGFPPTGQHDEQQQEAYDPYAAYDAGQQGYGQQVGMALDAPEPPKSPSHPYGNPAHQTHGTAPPVGRA